MIDSYTVEPIDETVARTCMFFIEAVKKSKSEVERAEVRLEDALRNYDDTDWEAGNVIRLAEEHLARCEAEYDANVARSAWEANRSFARVVTPGRPMPTPWKHAPHQWELIFIHYKLGRQQI